MQDLKEKYFLSISRVDAGKTAHQQNYEKLVLKKKYLNDVDLTLHKLNSGPHFLSDL